MSNKKIIIDIPFNFNFTNYFPERYPHVQGRFNLHFPRTQTKEWIDYRIEIFMKYTANSFINQINQNFLCILRYEEKTKEMIEDALNEYDDLPKNIIFVTNKEATKIIEDAINSYDYLYHVRIDSDNMYDKRFIDYINNYKPKQMTDCLLCYKGYIYEHTTSKLAKIIHGSPSFYVDIYNKDSYEKSFKDRLFEEHSGVAWNRKKELLEGELFMIICHETNIENKYEDVVGWLRGTKIENEEEKKSILTEWNIRYDE